MGHFSCCLTYHVTCLSLHLFLDFISCIVKSIIHYMIAKEGMCWGRILILVALHIMKLNSNKTSIRIPLDYTVCFPAEFHGSVGHHFVPYNRPLEKCNNTEWMFTFKAKAKVSFLFLPLCPLVLEPTSCLLLLLPSLSRRSILSFLGV